MVNRKIISAMVAASLFVTAPASASKLTSYQKRVADTVAEVTSDNWKQYGVLPSVAVGQTLIESSLGVNQVRPNNLWGLRPDGHYSSYTSLENGIRAYLKVLNNGRYDRGLFKKDYETQIDAILDGGYYGEDDGGTVSEYYRDVVSSIRRHRFDRYDKKLFKRLKKEARIKARKKAEKKRKKKWGKIYTLKYDAKLPGNKIKVNKKIIKGGAVQIWSKKELKGIYDVRGGQKGYTISVPDIRLDGMKVKIIVQEDAKG